MLPKYEAPKMVFHKNINVALNRIKTGASKEIIFKIRLCNNKDEITELKSQLPCILFSGIFTYRNSKSLVMHSGFICLDFDKFPDSDTLLTWKDTLQADEFTYCVFLSPSGNGLKCLIKIPPIKEYHKQFFDALKDYYDCPYFDKAVSDVCRICYESYDSYLTINENSSIWTERKEYKPIVLNLSDGPVDEQQSAKLLLKWWTKKYGIYDGERNTNLYKLCAAFNDYGISKEFAIDIALTFQQENFKHDEIMTTVNSAYKKTVNFGTLKFDPEWKKN